MAMFKQLLTFYFCWCCVFEVNGLLIGNNSTTNAELKEHIVQLESKFLQLEQQLQQLKSSCDTCTSSIHSLPAFMVSLTNDVTGCDVGVPLIFDHVIANVGSGYDARHGVFRAPRSGTYHFSSTVSAKPQFRFNIVLVKNTVDNEVAYLYNDDPSDIHWQLRSMSAVVELQAGDDVWFKCAVRDGSSVAGGAHYHSQFSGFLISET